MKLNFRKWPTLVVIAAIICACAAGALWYRSRSLSTAAMLRRLPLENSLVLYVDFVQLRRAGILQLLDGSKVGEDAEYRSFVRKTGFNYKQDLNTALVAFAPTGKYMLLDGHFDWQRLRGYTAAQGGKCYRSLCRMAGSAPERRISFFPVQRNVMALAVSADDSAAVRLEASAEGAALEIPNAPLWISIPASVLESGEDLPEGTRMFARSMGRAQTVTLSFAPEQNRLAARLNVLCRNELDAADVALDLNRITGLLRELIQRERQRPNPADLSGVLTSGSFRSDGRRVYGYWPIERSFVENMLGSR